MLTNSGPLLMKLSNLALGLILVGAASTYAGDGHDHDAEAIGAAAGANPRSAANHRDDHDDSPDHNSREDEHNEEAATQIKAELAAQQGIGIAEARNGTIERHVKVYGRLELPTDQHVSVQARFPGLIKSVSVKLGQTVAKGQVMAVVESNDSLKDYPLRAPIAGVVQSRQAGVGEITTSTPLFTLVNTQSLWATLKVFSNQRFEVEPGLAVHIVHNGHRHDGRIESLAPVSDGKPYILARTTLANPNGDMAPGDLVEGEIDAEVVSVPLVIDNRALQTLGTKQVVFVREGERYSAREVSLGRTDGTRSEVLSGLAVGEHYVVENSYLIKADIEKSGAAHEH